VTITWACLVCVRACVRAFVECVCVYGVWCVRAGQFSVCVRARAWCVECGACVRVGQFSVCVRVRARYLRNT
jgi:hypothetical protein